MLFPKPSKTKKKNPIAKFSNETKEAIVERDGSCVICGDPGTDCHHVYFSLQKEITEDRNDVSKGVLTCRFCHSMCHSCKMGTGTRQKCIDYLQEI